MPSRNDEQVIEVARLELQPEYYYKAVPVLTTHVYRLADLTNKSKYVLLPGEATMYIGSDFVGPDEPAAGGRSASSSRPASASIRSCRCSGR